MGSRVGLIALQDKDLSQLSAEMRTSVDMDVHELLESSYARARALLNKKRPELENLATALMKYETLDAQEVQLAMAGKKLERSI
jgi:ATP-dependent metalloprotease